MKVKVSDGVTDLMPILVRWEIEYYGELDGTDGDSGIQTFCPTVT